MINHYFFIFTAPPEDVSGSHGYSQVVGKDEVEIVCIPLNILVKSLMEALTGADILDLIQENGEVDPGIASKFPRAPHATPLAESPPPGPMMAEDGPPTVRAKEDGSAMVSTCATVSCM